MAFRSELTTRKPLGHPGELLRIWKELGFNWVQGGDRLVLPEPYINRTRSSFPYGKNDQLFDNQPRRTRRPCPCRQLLPSVAGSGGGMPHRMRSRLDGVWTRARNLFHFPPPFQPSITGCPSGAGKRYRPSAHHTFAYPGVVPAFSASSCCPALRLTLAPRAVCPLCLNHPPL